jgi:hypothetical protein
MRSDILVLIALASCRSGSPGGDAGRASVMDAADADRVVLDVGRDEPPGPPWEGGTWRLPWRDGGMTNAPPRCGTATPIVPYATSGSATCFNGRSMISGGAAYWAWTIGSQGMAGSLSFPDNMIINLDCHDRAVVAGVTSFRRGSTALMIFESPSAEGRVVWQQEIERSMNAREVGVGILQATPEMIIYELWLPGDTGFRVAGPHGEHPRMPRSIFNGLRGEHPDTVQAQGNRALMAVVGDIYLYTDDPPGDGTFENLSQHPADQVYAWMDGRFVTWIDYRHTRSDWSKPGNPEVYLYDRDAHTATRITHDPDDRPVVQRDPRVYGEWLVWIDQRNSPSPDLPTADQPAELRARHIPTGREFTHFAPGLSLSAPVPSADGIYLNCGQLSPDRFFGVYRVPLPTLPGEP